ncbi:MAG: type II toxin-antitoxin system death-on-curing family toxin [Lachnospiraceae bacterium]|nr:type II toxin-antitoxin system death-on-curing family toxin [Ruminococcus sp.]MCM1274758.1 type II toxin-antitoxin system death-on-curing family toxin [Lachnospiraceae bacterium]
MIRLTEQQVLSVHKMMIKATGGSDGVRDLGLMRSALNTPFQSLRKRDVSVAFVQSGGNVPFGHLKSPFVDGNKRIGIHVMLIFLELSGVQPDYTQKELINLGLGVASGNLNVNDILNWLTGHCG